MKKSIGIIAAVLLSASVYSQCYDSAQPHSSFKSQQSGSSLESYSSRSSEFSPGSAEFDAQSSLRAQGDYNNGAAKQGLTLTDEEAAQTLRNTDDVDLANRNQEQGLTDPDHLLNNNNDSEPDRIYEEWILITPEDVGGPPESETGTNNQSHTDVPATPEWDPEEEFFSQFNNETSQLNGGRSYNGSDYSQDYVGGPAQSQSGSNRSSDMDDDDCEVNYQHDRYSTSVQGSGSARDHDNWLNGERENIGGPAQFQSESRSWEDNRGTVRSSGSAIDHDERYRIDRSKSEDSNSSLDNYRGTDAQNESDSGTISEPADTDTNRRSDLNEQESASDTNTIPPDL